MVIKSIIFLVLDGLIVVLVWSQLHTIVYLVVRTCHEGDLLTAKSRKLLLILLVILQLLILPDALLCSMTPARVFTSGDLSTFLSELSGKSDLITYGLIDQFLWYLRPDTLPLE